MFYFHSEFLINKRIRTTFYDLIYFSRKNAPNKFLIKRSKPLNLNAALSLLSIQLQVKDCGQYTVCMYEDLLLFLLLLLATPTYSQGTAIWYDCFKWWYQHQIFIKSTIQCQIWKAHSILFLKVSLEVEFDQKWRELWRFQKQNKGIFPLKSALAEIENRYSVFPTFMFCLVLASNLANS